MSNPNHMGLKSYNPNPLHDVNVQLGLNGVDISGNKVLRSKNVGSPNDFSLLIEVMAMREAIEEAEVQQDIEVICLRKPHTVPKWHV